ncbi:MAG: VCBS repeat-containing protein [Rhodobacteraceae bacterium]|nr:VCBS repeat-containing protein [Paracoccaceae bacterium]
MRAGARRRLSRPWRPFARRAAIPAAFLLASIGAGSQGGASEAIVSAAYTAPTGRYPHGALGDTTEHAGLSVRLSDGRTLGVRFDKGIVFEDTEPRLADLDGDGAPEVIVVESDPGLGARLAVWTLRDRALYRLAATDFIGKRFRWLAPVGAADLDGDGQVEIAYVETPHLGKVLKIVRLAGDRLVPVAKAAGLTNHVNGDTFIQGGVFRCGEGMVLLTADARWTRIVGTMLDRGRLRHRDLGPYEGPESFGRIAGCRAAMAAS